MDNAKQQNVISVNSQVMELQQLIAGPLVSTIEADTLSSRRYLEMLQLIAFEDVTEGDRNIRRLRTLKFAYQETNVNGYRNKVVSIPLVTLLPLPLLQIKEADFDFDINILDAVSSGTVESFDYGEGKIEQNNENRRPFRLRASLAPKSGSGSYSDKSEQQLSANMKVHVKMRQADMPAGLSNLLRLTAGNLQVEDAEAPDETEPEKTE
ncbi:MAG: DUF2589 domain-containing protein [Prevotella sp.]|jgi:hypothetical protein|nr:DUF2589 domain-containing protein [Prevotella sp.]MBR6086833.1 DUF2589 domain-containing protein [Prevotella sp.]